MKYPDLELIKNKHQPMKKLLVLLILLVVSHASYAQLFSKEKIKNLENFDKQFLSWGYFLGLNNYDFNFDYNEDKKDILVETSFGFSVGLIGNMRINDYFDIRLEPGLYVAKRDLIYDESYFDGMDFNNSDLLREVNSTYIHVPLLIKVSTKRINNFKPFIIGGISTSLNLSSNEKNLDDNDNGEFRTKTNVFSYELGFGIDIYLYWFKFTPSIRGVFTLNDELVRDEDPASPWTGNVASMKSRGVFINFTFQ